MHISLVALPLLALPVACAATAPGDDATITIPDDRMAAAPRSSASAPHATPRPTPPWTRHTFEVGDQAVTLCLPAKPSAATRKDFDSIHFANIDVPTEIGEIWIEIMNGSSGPFPMEANLPSKNSTQDLVRTDKTSEDRWLFTTRGRDDGAPGVTSRISDAYGEDMMCTAHGVPTQDAPALAAGFAIIERVCRSLEMVKEGRDASPCQPAN